MIQTFLSAFVLFLPLIIWAGILLRKKAWLIIPTLVLSVVTYAIWRFQSPYPSPLNWDLWEHQTIVNHILKGQFAILPSTLSDTFRFDGYTTLFHYLVAAAQSLFRPDILGFWWFADYFLLLTTAVAATTLVYHLTKRTIPAIAAGIFSLFFFESSIVFATLFFMPQTLVAVLWVLCFATLISWEKRPGAGWLIVASAIILIPMHFIVGTAGVLLLIAYFILEKTDITKHRAFFAGALILIPVILYFGLSAASNILHLQSLNYGEATAFTQTIPEKLALFRTWYGFLPIIFLPLGIFQASKTVKTRNLTVLYAITMGIVLAAFPYAMKFYALGRYLSVAIMAVGVSFVIDTVSSAWSAPLILICIAVNTGLLFYTNAWTWQESLVFQSRASHISTEEYTAAEYIRQHYSATNVFLVSDPATQSLMEALTGIESQGGVYMNNRSRTLLAEAFKAQTTEQFTHTILSITDEVNHTNKSTYLVLISARLIRWIQDEPAQQMNIAFNIWRPQALSVENQSYVGYILATFHLKPVFRNDSMVIVEIQGNL